MTSAFIAIQLLWSLFLPMRNYFNLHKAFYLLSYLTGSLKSKRIHMYLPVKVDHYCCLLS